MTTTPPDPDALNIARARLRDLTAAAYAGHPGTLAMLEQLAHDLASAPPRWDAGDALQVPPGGGRLTAQVTADQADAVLAVLGHRVVPAPGRIVLEVRRG